ISKQNEALHELKKLLFQANIHNDFLVENFFYSLTPKFMQTILPTFVLKKLFIIVLEAVEYNYLTYPYFMKTQIIDGYLLVSIAAINPSVKEYIEEGLERFNFESSSFTSSYLNIYDISCISYLLKYRTSEEYHEFLQKLMEKVKTW